ncbi:protein kinase domain family protein [Aspergillus niger]|nr:protein kinase domain family protein [Aspergillus niger]
MSSSQLLFELLSSLPPQNIPGPTPLAPDTDPDINLTELDSSEFKSFLSTDPTSSFVSPSLSPSSPFLPLHGDRFVVRSGFVKKVSTVLQGATKRRNSTGDSLASLLHTSGSNAYMTVRARSVSPRDSPANSSGPVPTEQDPDYIQEHIKVEEDVEEFVSDADEVDPSELKIDHGKRSRKKRRDIDATYIPGKDDDEDDTFNPDSNGIDSSELIDRVAKKNRKRKPGVDATYMPGKEDDGDSSQDNEATARAPKKRRVIPNSALVSSVNARHLTPEKPIETEFPVTPSAQIDPVYQQGMTQFPQIDNGTTDLGAIPYPTPDTLRKKSTTKAGTASSAVPHARHVPKKTPKKENEEYVPGETMFPEPEATPIMSIEAENANTAYLTEDDNEEYQDRPIHHTEKTGIVFDFSVERAKRWASAINVPKGLFNEEEKDLFFRLAMRGFEPVVPRSWRYDFPTLPESLYPRSSEASDKPIIDVTRSSNLYGELSWNVLRCETDANGYPAIKALTSLFAVGGRVRDCDILLQQPEPLIKQAIQKYIHWALFDVELDTMQDALPVHVIYAQKKDEKTIKAVRKMNTKLQKLTRRHQEELGVTINNAPDKKVAKILEDTKFPLLTGFIICGPIVAILTHSTDPREIGNGEEDGRFISQFDLSERGQDVWNSLAIAITVMHVRRTMLSLAHQGKGSYQPGRKRSALAFDVDR